jgi:hypothetical protein
MRVQGGLLPVSILGLTLLAGAILHTERREVQAARQPSSGELPARRVRDLHPGEESPTQLDEKVYLPAILKRCSPDPPGESDNVDDALTVCSGQTVSGQVSQSDLDDVYRILTVADQQLTIAMNGSGGDADLYLYPPGTTDVDTDPWSAVSNNDDNNEFIQGTVLVGGYWYIDVFSWSGKTNYNVTVTLSGSEAAPTITFNLTNVRPIHDRRQGK